MISEYPVSKNRNFWGSSLPLRRSHFQHKVNFYDWFLVWDSALQKDKEDNNLEALSPFELFLLTNIDENCLQIGEVLEIKTLCYTN